MYRADVGRGVFKSAHQERKLRQSLATIASSLVGTTKTFTGDFAALIRAALAIIFIWFQRNTQPVQLIANQLARPGRVFTDSRGEDQGVQPANGWHKTCQYTGRAIVEKINGVSGMGSVALLQNIHVIADARRHPEGLIGGKANPR